MKKPVIGITPLYDSQGERYFMRSGYTKGIEKAGGTPLILPITTDKAMLDQLAELCDGFVFAGGHDIQGKYYGQSDELSGVPCAERDEMELYLFDRIRKMDKPALGICRGIQLFNIGAGGDLYQDLSSQYPGSLRHFVRSSAGQGIPADDDNRHAVNIDKDSDLYDLIGQEQIEVNSFHHQGLKTLPENVEVMARADDGVIEAMKLNNQKWIWGVQWHPEIIYPEKESSFRLFEELVRQAAN